MPARVILGVGAGIAAYKSCELLRLLTESGHHVRVVPTPDALRFVGEATWAALSGEPVTTDAWTGVAEVPHVRLGQSADLVVVAPATADLMARAAAGMAGDLLTATLLTAQVPGPVRARHAHRDVGAPRHPGERVAAAPPRRHRARARGRPPDRPGQRRRAAARAGRDLRGRDPAAGPRPRPPRRDRARTRCPDLAGRRVVVSAGGTREEIDPVRFIGNWSTGTQGYALARTAVARGAEVILVAANVALPDPAGAKVTRVVSAREMRDAVLAAASRGVAPTRW